MPSRQPRHARRRLGRLLLAAAALLTGGWSLAAPAAAAPRAAAAPQVAQGGACNAFRGAYALPASYHDGELNVPACGPIPGGGANQPKVYPYPGAFYTPGYQCVELAERYLYYKYGVTMTLSTNGDQVADHYGSKYPGLFQIVPNGTVNRAPVQGDVLSVSQTPTFSSPYGGHTAVVQSSLVDGTGNGTVTIIEENATSAGSETLQLRSWRISYGGMPYAKWLHRNGNAGAPIPDGTFVAYQTAVYRIAGGAPIYVSDWNAVGGGQPYMTLNDQQWAALLAVPVDGTLLAAGPGGPTYAVAGGAPLPAGTVGSSGRQPVVVDPAAIANAGGAAPYDRLLAHPVDGTFLAMGQDGATYRVAGGAALPVTDCAALGGCAQATIVDPPAAAAPRAASPGPRLASAPADGTVVRTLPSGNRWVFVSGSCAPGPLTAAAVSVNDASVSCSAPAAALPSSAPAQPDLLGTHRATVATYQPSSGNWWAEGVAPLQYGQPGDIPVPADYSGSGHTVPAVFRPSTGQWWVLGHVPVVLGGPGDIPVPGDYDGDGRADPAVYRPSTGEWLLANGMTVRYGQPGDVPVPGDYDGNGRTDVAIYRPSTGEWWVRGLIHVFYGRPGDVPTQADFTGDRRADIGVYRPGTGEWWVQGTLHAFYGQPGDVPVPGDWNGDGRAEVAVYRASTGQWWIRGVACIVHGAPGTLPV